MVCVKEPIADDDSQANLVISDFKLRRIDVFCKINQQATLHVQSILEEMKKRGGPNGKERKVTVVVNTRGGEALQGLAIYDLLRSSGFRIMTIVLGEVASSGLAIVLAGHERLMHRNSVLNFHQTAMEFEKGQSVKVLRQEEVEIERAQTRIVDALYAKITLENSRISLRQLRALERREAYVTAEQALKMGFVHKLIEHLESHTP